MKVCRGKLFGVCTRGLFSVGWSSGDAQGSSAEPSLLPVGSSLTLTRVHTPLQLKITSKMLFSLEERRLRVFSSITDSVKIIYKSFLQTGPNAALCCEGAWLALAAHTHQGNPWRGSGLLIPAGDPVWWKDFCFTGCFGGH